MLLSSTSIITEIRHKGTLANPCDCLQCADWHIAPVVVVPPAVKLHSSGDKLEGMTAQALGCATSCGMSGKVGCCEILAE